MGSQNLTTEEKVDRLYGQIESLSRRVADLEEQLAASARDRSAAASAARQRTTPRRRLRRALRNRNLRPPGSPTASPTR